MPKTGILLADKQKGWTSHDVVAVLRTILKATTIGHAGTLDPAATGLVVVLVGRGATKYQGALQKGDKEYKAKVTFGIETDMWDMDPQSKILKQENKPEFPLSEINQKLALLTGTVNQIVPSYSAVKKQGRPMYAWARDGVVMEQKVRPAVIRSITDVEYKHPDLYFSVSCAGGTYIRSLAYMLGQSLGAPSVLADLRRTKANGYNVEDALSIETLKKMTFEEVENRILPIEEEAAKLL